ncbi:MAG: hypothetical protein IT379_02375 [Deltaproteobacteria bacterium]|nr:hypothetical protein [Deltaproteobacteria bacterium]
MEALSWDEICSRNEYRGRWVALAGCRYDHTSARPIGGTVVDVDDDLVELCSRMREAGRSSCSILFCEVPEEADPIETHGSRRSGLRAVAH